MRLPATLRLLWSSLTRRSGQPHSTVPISRRKIISFPSFFPSAALNIVFVLHSCAAQSNGGKKEKKIKRSANDTSFHDVSDGETFRGTRCDNALFFARVSPSQASRWRNVSSRATRCPLTYDGIYAIDIRLYNVTRTRKRLPQVFNFQPLKGGGAHARMPGLRRKSKVPCRSCPGMFPFFCSSPMAAPHFAPGDPIR